MRSTHIKIGILAAIIALTVAIHYGWVLENIFGHHAWVHSVHGRFCYVPILIGAAWFGLRGGLISAASISLLILPYLSGQTGHMGGDISDEIVEVLFYFGIGTLVGVLVDRESLFIRKQEKTQFELERARHLSLVGQMAASVAHEIKNPLASIKGATEIIVDEQTAPTEKKEFQGILSREIKRIDSIVKEFLQFARPRETLLSHLDLSHTVTASITQIAPQVAVQGIKISETIEPELQIMGDQEKLHQVTLNLVLNAAQASGPGSTIGILVRKVTASQAEFVVRDQGKGIEPAQLGRVFEPFYSTKSSGTGLGLAIVKSIIEDHHGSISISSVVGQGTQVQIVLPLVRGSV